MKNNFLIIVSLIGIITLSVCISLNHKKDNDTIELENNIANRYIKVFGNPQTADEQCKFDYIIYNDSTECKNN